MNPRYLAYANAHNMTPDEMLEHDTQRWRGGKMTGFILWVSERRREWLSTFDRSITKTEEIEDNYSQWLLAKYPAYN